MSVDLLCQSHKSPFLFSFLLFLEFLSSLSPPNRPDYPDSTINESTGIVFDLLSIEDNLWARNLRHHLEHNPTIPNTQVFCSFDPSLNSSSSGCFTCISSMFSTGGREVNHLSHPSANDPLQLMRPFVSLEPLLQLAPGLSSAPRQVMSFLFNLDSKFMLFLFGC